MIELLVPPLFVAALVVDNDSGMLAMLVFLVILPHALFSLRPSACLSFQASWPVWTRRTVARSSLVPAVTCARLVLLVLRLAVCSLWLSAGPWAGRFGPEEQLCAWLVYWC